MKLYVDDLKYRGFLLTLDTSQGRVFFKGKTVFLTSFDPLNTNMEEKLEILKYYVRTLLKKPEEA